MDFEKLRLYRNIKNNFANLLGIKLSEISEGYAKAEMDVKTELLNFHYLRAGINTKKLFATTTEIKRGKKILVYSISVTDQDDVELAVGIFSFMSIGKPIEL